MMERWRRLKQLLDDLRETRGYWKLTEEALDHSLWKRFWTYRKIAYGVNGHKFHCIKLHMALEVLISLITPPPHHPYPIPNKVW